MCLSVCLSVRLSQVGVKKAKPGITQTTPYDSPNPGSGTPFFSDAKNFGEIPNIATPTEAPNSGGRSKSAMFD